MEQNKIKRGKFIVCEGLDGCGKSTQVKTMEIYLNELHTDGYLPTATIATREPDSDNAIGKLIRQALKGYVVIGQNAMAHLHVADRFEHIALVERMLAEGKNVICDRYVMSNMAYNATCPSEIEYIFGLNKECLERLKPDATIYFDLSPEECAKRRSARDGKELYDDINWQKRIARNYVKAIDIFNSNGMPVYCVDASLSAEEVSENVCKVLDRVFHIKKS